MVISLDLDLDLVLVVVVHSIHSVSLSSIHFGACIFIVVVLDLDLVPSWWRRAAECTVVPIPRRGVYVYRMQKWHYFPIQTAQKLKSKATRRLI